MTDEVRPLADSPAFSRRDHRETRLGNQVPTAEQWEPWEINMWFAKKEKPDIERLKAERNFIRLIELLKYPDRDVRAGAVKALGEIGGRRELDDLIKLLKDGDPFVRQNVIKAIGKIIKDAFEQIKKSGNQACENERIALKNKLRNPAKNLLNTLINQEKDKYVRETAKTVLSELSNLLE